MDGNRTWAKNKNLPQMEWHKRGYDNIEKILNLCLAKNLEFASFWALSDDNIRERSDFEVKYLFDLLVKGIKKLIIQANEKNIRLYFIGDRELIRKDCCKAIEQAEEDTKNNSGMSVIFAIAYGWQEEIVRAVRLLAERGIDIKNISKQDIDSVIDSGKFPPPDIIIRTGGHIRHSWYFLFQSPYSEYFFSEKNWPDFDEVDFEKAYQSFSQRVRKFWK